MSVSILILCTHYIVQEFTSDYKEFKERIAEIDQRLGCILCQAFEDCSGCKSAFKVYIPRTATCHIVWINH